MNRVQVVLSGFSVRLFCLGKYFLCMYGCMYFLAALVLVCVDVMVMSSALRIPWPELVLFVVVCLQCKC